MYGISIYIAPESGSGGCSRKRQWLYGEVKKHYFLKNGRPLPKAAVEPLPKAAVAFNLGLIEAKDILKQESVYQIGLFSRNVRLNWPHKSSGEAILYDGCNMDSPKKIGQMAPKESEARGLRGRPQTVFLPGECVA